MHALKKPTVNALNTRSVLKALDRHVRVAECVVRGYLTMYQDLLVLVESTVRRPTKLQLEACIRETEKLAALIDTSSARVMADLSLSTLISASPEHKVVQSAAATANVFRFSSTIAISLSLTALLLIT